MSANTLIYCDGSCPVPHGPGGWAFAHVTDDDKNYYASGFMEKATNNTAELMAALQALRYCKAAKLRKTKIVIRTDSMYVVNGMMGWRHKEALHDFKGVVNRELWARLHHHAEYCKSLNFIHIKGHAGHYWNEYVDAMAGAVVRQAKRDRININEEE